MNRALGQLVRSTAGQRRMARVRPEGWSDRLGPETPIVFTYFGIILTGYVGLMYMVNEGTAKFEVENPWEHLYAQIPRTGHGTMTGMNT